MARDDSTPLWISHHWPEHHDRCASVGGVHVCRRCLVLYPLVVVTSVVALLAGSQEWQSWATPALWLLPLPMAIDWIAEHLGAVRYSPTRQIAVTVVGAPAFGLALARHVEAPFDPAATLPVAAYVAVLSAVAIWSWSRRSREAEPTWERDHDRAEAERSERLRDLLDLPGSERS